LVDVDRRPVATFKGFFFLQVVPDLECATYPFSAQRLDEVQAEVAAMATSCAQMKGRLQTARAQTAGVVDRTNELQARQYVFPCFYWPEPPVLPVHWFGSQGAAHDIVPEAVTSGSTL
jgi:hypothetical protein